MTNMHVTCYHFLDLQKHKLYYTHNGSCNVSYSCFQLPKSSTSSINSLENFARDIHNTGQSMYHAMISTLMPNDTCINPVGSNTYQYDVHSSIRFGKRLFQSCDDNHNISQQPWKLPCSLKNLGRNYHSDANSIKKIPNCMGERRVYGARLLPMYP